MCIHHYVGADIRSSTVKARIACIVRKHKRTELIINIEKLLKRIIVIHYAPCIDIIIIIILLLNNKMT